MRAERGNPVEVRPCGRSADREEGRVPGGQRMTEKRMPVAERQRETIAADSSFSGWSWLTGRIPGLVPGRESGLTRSGEPVKRKMNVIPEPEGKLDATARSW